LLYSAIHSAICVGIRICASRQQKLDHIEIVRTSS
jgi:hypothetical protein